MEIQLILNRVEKTFSKFYHTIKYELTTLSNGLTVRNRITNLILKCSFDLTYVLKFQMRNTTSLYTFTFQNISYNFKKTQFEQASTFQILL
jgi:hypothetical protein